VTPERADLETRAAAALELRRRRDFTPLAYSSLWDRDEPRTSQRRALLPLLDASTLVLLVLGGNRAGKSDVITQYGSALAAGRDAVIHDPVRRIDVPWVRLWLARNGYPEALIPTGPDRVWVGSPSFGAAVEQIRPKFTKYLPAGTRYLRWDDKQSEAEARLPGGGVIVSKAYKQYDGDPQTWEGANPRGILLDEQPNRHSNLTAALSRLVDKRGRIVCALTPLRGTADWLYRDVVKPSPAWLRMVHLYGEDNPHIPQDMLAMMLAAMPEWQRASRARGAFSTPEGARFTFLRGVHTIAPFAPPTHWLRVQGWDWGSRSPHVVWFAEAAERLDLGNGRELVPGDVVVYRELAERQTTMQPGIPDRTLIAWAKEREAGTPEGSNQVQCVRVSDSEDPGAIAQAAELGLWLQPAAKGPGSINDGLDLIEALLQAADALTGEAKRPRLYVCEDCPALIEELEGLKWARERDGVEPGPDPTCPDHGIDALRYGLQLRQTMGFR